MAESISIQEGFLCPICHKDLRSPQKLISHFQNLHSEEQDKLKSLKEFCAKAKKKILKFDEEDLEIGKKEPSLEYLFLKPSEPQLGGYASHNALFKEIRRWRLDHQTAETNKLIIRLDKLLRLDGTDRKQKEQFLVSWLDGTTVNRCPSCAASFNITRRQHHCRLCGSIMCNDCSTFLPLERAQSIVAPVQHLGIGNKEEIKMKDNEQFRICCHCSTMIERRRIVQAEQMMQPIISQLYAHLQKTKMEVESMVDLYNRMYDSLTRGDTTFQLQDAQSLKASIASKAEIIDTISKKISNLPVDDTHSRAQTVQINVRRATSNYIKDYLLSLAPLPSLEDLAAIKQDRTLKMTEDDKDDNQIRIKKVTVTTGWSPSSHDNVVKSEEDPLIEQINIVRNYIAQARKAQRFEEVASLEENLKLLKDAYKNNQLSMQEQKL